MALTHDVPLRPEDERIDRVEERLVLGRRVTDRGGVRVSTRTLTSSETVTGTALEHGVEVERVPVGRFVEAAESPRVEQGPHGDLTILPVYEERIIVETRLFLVEEVHVRQRARSREVEIPVEIRRQVADVERLPPLAGHDHPIATSDQGVTTMITDDNTTWGSRTLTAMFDTSAEAERAVDRLKRAGVADGAISVTAGASDYDSSTYSGQNRGFWDSLSDFFFPDEDRYAYAEGLSRGAQLVTVRDYDASMHDTVVDILDDEGSVDLNSREEEWRSSGWGDYRSSDYYDEDEYNRTHRTDNGAMGTSPAAADASTRSTEVVGGAVDNRVGGPDTRGTIYDDGVSDRPSDAALMGSETTGSGMEGTERAGVRDEDLDSGDTVKVMEERLDVGKRDVSQGSVRVRSYVREEPVTADVDLRSTRVYVERRPVDRAAAAGDTAFQDRTIEAREYAEEPVVRKEARVVEEIGLRKETESHTETVNDTVRHTEVEIEDERTGETTRISGDDDRT